MNIKGFRGHISEQFGTMTVDHTHRVLVRLHGKSENVKPEIILNFIYFERFFERNYNFYSSRK